MNISYDPIQFVPGWLGDIMMYVYGQFHMAGRGGQCGNTSGPRCGDCVTPCNPALIRDRYTSHLHYISTLHITDTDITFTITLSLLTVGPQDHRIHGLHPERGGHV